MFVSLQRPSTDVAAGVCVHTMVHIDDAELITVDYSAVRPTADFEQ